MPEWSVDPAAAAANPCSKFQISRKFACGVKVYILPVTRVTQDCEYHPQVPQPTCFWKLAVGEPDYLMPHCTYIMVLPPLLELPKVSSVSFICMLCCFLAQRCHHGTCWITISFTIFSSDQEWPAGWEVSGADAVNKVWTSACLSWHGFGFVSSIRMRWPRPRPLTTCGNCGQRRAWLC